MKVTRLYFGAIKSIGFVDRGANKDADILIAKRASSDTPDGYRDVPLSFEVSKIDDEERRVVAWAYVARKRDGELSFDDGGTSRDADGNLIPNATDRDVVDTPEAFKAFKDAFYSFIASGKAGSDDMHVDFDVAKVVGGMVFDADVTKSLGIPDGTMHEGGVVVIEIPRTERGNKLWADIKAGKRKQLSVVASIKREVVDETAIKRSAEQELAALVADYTNAAKAGRKMSKQRLMQLRQAVQTLSGLLSQVEPAEEADKMAKDNQKTASEGTFDASSLPEDAQKHVAAVEKKAADAASEIEALKAEVEALKAAKEPESTEPEEVAKRIADPVAREQFLAMKAEQDAMRAEVAKAAETAKAERDARVTAEFVAKCKAELPAITAKAEEFGVVLKRASEALGAEDFAEIHRVLKAASEQLATSDLFKSIGHDGDSSGQTAWEQIEKQAREILDKGEAPTIQIARDRVMQTNPDLASKAISERH